MILSFRINKRIEYLWYCKSFSITIQFGPTIANSDHAVKTLQITSALLSSWWDAWAQFACFWQSDGKNPVICDNSALLWPILQSVTAAKLNMNVCMCSLLLLSTFTLSDKTNNGAGSRGDTVLVHLQYKCSGFSVKRKKQSWVNFFFYSFLFTSQREAQTFSFIFS